MYSCKWFFVGSVLLTSVDQSNYLDSDPESPSKIKGAYPTLAYALDTVSEGDTTKNVVESLGEKATGKRVIRLLPGDGGVGETDVRIEFIVVCTDFSAPNTFGLLVD